jgi:hypothetical protein
MFLRHQFIMKNVCHQVQAITGPLFIAKALAVWGQVYLQDRQQLGICHHKTIRIITITTIISQGNHRNNLRQTINKHSKSTWLPPKNLIWQTIILEEVIQVVRMFLCLQVVLTARRAQLMETIMESQVVLKL